MFEIKNDYPWFKVAKGVILQKGNIAQLAVEDSQSVAIKSDGTAPLGLVICVEPETNEVCISYKRIYIESSFYEEDCLYPINSNLYVSPLGLFTTNRFGPNYPSIAMVTDPPSALRATLKLVWF